MSEPPGWPHFRTWIPDTKRRVTVYYKITPEEKADQHGPHFPADAEIEVWWAGIRIDECHFPIEAYAELVAEAFDDAKERDEDDRNPSE